MCNSTIGFGSIIHYVQLASSFRMAGKEVAGGVLRERKPFFRQL